MRMDKINEMVKRELSHLLLVGDVNDPRVALVTVMNVDVSKDLQHARVKFSVLSDDPKVIKNAIDGMNSCKGFIRKIIGQRVVLRYTPEFQFIYDKGVKYAADIDATLAEIKKTLKSEG